MNARTVLVSFALGLAGCASPGEWHYRPHSASVAERPLGVRIAVVPFRDARGTANSDGSLLFLVPISPIGIVDHAEHDDSRFHERGPRDEAGYVAILVIATTPGLGQLGCS